MLDIKIMFMWEIPFLYSIFNDILIEHYVNKGNKTTCEYCQEITKKKRQLKNGANLFFKETTSNPRWCYNLAYLKLWNLTKYANSVSCIVLLC